MTAQKWSLLPRASWRRSALLLVALTSTLTVLLLVLMIPSIIHRQGLTTRLFSGSCTQASRLSLGLHVAINIVATGVLASSNFFMQVLAAPTRQEVDRAHARRSWLEIGVQSVRNLRSVPLLHRILWVLLSVTAIPLHLIFNSIVIETKASTNALAVLASESFIYGADRNGSLPILSSFPAYHKIDRRSWGGHGGGDSIPDTSTISPLPPDEIANTVRDISNSLQSSPEKWDNLNIQECINRYSEDLQPPVLTEHRHVVMVISNMNETAEQTQGWTAAEVYLNATADAATLNAMSPLWLVAEFGKTDVVYASQLASDGPLGQQLSSFSNLAFNTDDFQDGMIRVESAPTYGGGDAILTSLIQDRYLTMRIHYCRSESVTMPCNVDVNNELFGIICLFCFTKVALCLAALRLLRRRSPLITPGDAIESFIMQPDSTTKGMASASWHVFKKRKIESLGSSPQMLATPWKRPSRSALHAIPATIWIWSYLLIGICLTVAGVFYHQAAENYSLSSSQFGDSSGNPPVLLNGESSLKEGNSASTLVLIANTPQLILSICYLVYNGLFTRLCSEYEWAAYSTKFATLRVSDKKGQQRSTYRLQLPYRWAIPLLITSTVLHWLFSNCIYVVLFEGYSAYWPYPSTIYSGMLYSEIAILISLVICCALAVVPLVVSLVVKLPGQMVVMGSCSAVISAACHCNNTALSSDDVSNHSRPNFGIPDSVDSPLNKSLSGGKEIGLEMRANDYEGATEMTTLYQNSGPQASLFNVAVGKLKWGVVSDVWKAANRYESELEHFAFGSEGQEVIEPADGRIYT